MTTDPLSIENLPEGVVDAWLVGEPTLIRMPHVAPFGGAKFSIVRAPAGASAAFEFVSNGGDITPDRPGRWIVQVTIGAATRRFDAIAFEREHANQVRHGGHHHHAALPILRSLVNSAGARTSDGALLLEVLVSRLESDAQDALVRVHEGTGIHRPARGHLFAGMWLAPHGAAH